MQYIVFINSKFNVPNLVHVVFHNGSNYGYHFILKEFIKKMYFLWKIQKSANIFPFQ